MILNIYKKGIKKYDLKMNEDLIDNYITIFKYEQN
jgi:hypothetical protein